MATLVADHITPCHIAIEPEAFGIFDSNGHGVDAALDSLINGGPLAYAVRATKTDLGVTAKATFCCVSTRVLAAEAEWVTLRVQEPTPWRETIESLCRLTRDSGVEVLFHRLPTSSTYDSPYLVCRKESLEQLVVALVHGGCFISPSTSVCPVPSLKSNVVSIPDDHVGAWKRKGSTPEVIRLQTGCGYFVDVSLPDPGSSVTPQASYGVITRDSHGLRRQCIVDFSPPSGPSKSRPVSLSPQGNVLRISAPEGSSEVEEEWQRLDASTAGPPNFTILELQSEDIAGTEARAGMWLFCGNTFACCIGPRLGEGIVSQWCCRDLDHLRSWKGAAVDRELASRYEAILGTVDKPGVLRLIRKSWENVGPDTFHLDVEKGIGGSFRFISEGVLEQKRPNGDTLKWIVRDMPFNPFFDSTPACQEIEAKSASENGNAKEKSKKHRESSSSSSTSEHKDKKRSKKRSSSSSSKSKRRKVKDKKGRSGKSSQSSSQSSGKRRKKKSRSRSKNKKKDKDRDRKRSKSRSRSGKKNDKKRDRSRSRSDRKKRERSKSRDKKKGKDRALSQSPQPATKARFDVAPSPIDMIANAKTGQAAMKALQAQAILRSSGLSQSMPPPTGLAPGMTNALAPGSYCDEVETFLLMNPVDPEAATRLRSLPPHLRRVVMDRGPLQGTRNPSSVLIVRIRDAETGRGVGVPQGLGMPAPPATTRTDPNIERMIMQFRLDARAAGMLRSLPPEQQRIVAATMPLHEARNPSAFVMAQLSGPNRFSNMPANTSAFGGYNVL